MNIPRSDITYNFTQTILYLESILFNDTGIAHYFAFGFEASKPKLYIFVYANFCKLFIKKVS